MSAITALTIQALAHVQSLPEGGLLSPKDLLHLGSRAAVDQTLSRLAKGGQLLRVARGFYVASVHSRFGSRPPAPEKVVAALAARGGEVAVPHGANAAHGLGLTQQVPIREVFCSAGRDRTLTLGRSQVQIKHVPRWMLALGTGPAGAAVRALAWMGPNHAAPSLTKLRRSLSPADWHALTTGRAALPSWMAKAIGEAAARSG